ncbi:MAG: DUF1631 family protein [Betaproteobacteria bacterium]|nr:DUF1631 family protein [Betaproteobacteria bacterium]
MGNVHDSKPSGADKRFFDRHPIRLTAVWGVPGRPDHPAEIQDFCLGGLFVALGDAPTADSLPPDKIVEIRCSVAAGTQRQDLRFRGRVVRIHEGGAGIALIDPELAAIHALHAYAKAHPVDAGPSAPKNRQDIPDRTLAETLLEVMRKTAERHLLSIAHGFLKQAPERFLIIAGKTEDKAEKLESYNAAEILTRQGEGFLRTFGTAVTEMLAQTRPDSTAPSRELVVPESGLGLMEDTDFEDWLALTEMAQRVEEGAKGPLFDFETRLARLFPSPLGKEDNPFGPTRIGRAFQDTIRTLELPRKPFIAVHTMFRDAFAAQATQMYTEISRHLIDNAIAPAAAKPPGAAARQPRPEVRPPQPNTVPPPARFTSGEDAPPPAGRPASPANPGARDWYGLIDDLRSLRQWVGRQSVHPASHPPAPTRMPGGANAPEKTPSPPPFTPEDIIRALGQLQLYPGGGAAAARTAPDLKSHVLSLLQHREPTGKRLSDREARILEISSVLYEAMLADQLIPDVVKPWLQQVLVPMIKLAIRDDSLFIDKSHPARQVINGIAQLEAFGGDGKNTTIAKRIGQALDSLVNAEDLTPAMLEGVMREVGGIIRLQTKAYELNLQEVLAACETEAAHGAREVPAESSIPSGPEPLTEWRNRARRLKAGEWMLVDHGQGPQRLRLTWIAEHFDRYVFTDHRGQREATLTLDDLAERLRQGTAMVLADGGESVLDRAQFAPLQKMHRELLHESTHDKLTGLANRRAFEQHLTARLARAREDQMRHVVCYINLDGFSMVNSAFGYEGGDRLLKEAAGLFRAALGKYGDDLARIGADEFGLLLEDCEVSTALETIATLKRAIGDYRFVAGDSKIAVSFSAGIAILEPFHESATAILQDAESCCRAARVRGANQVQVHASEASGPFSRNSAMKWAARIDNLLATGMLDLHVQPIASLRGPMRIDHSEILLRVRDEHGQLASPQEFILAAEQFRRINAVDRWVVEQTFAWMAAFPEALHRTGNLSINLSGASINDPTMIDFIVDKARVLGVPMARVCFEVTETAGISSLSAGSEFLLRLKRETGCRFSLDDFGTGLSSYAYLRNLPVDFLKIDGTFIRHLDDSPSDYAVAKSITEIGHFMGKQVIAECVENEAILAVLRELGIDHGQGYAIGKPVRLKDISGGAAARA